VERDQSGQVKTSLLKGEPTVWLLRFDSTGQVLAKGTVKVNFAFVRIAAFPSGLLLAVGYLSPGLVPGRHRPAPFSAIISADGSLVLPVKLPETVLDPEPKKDGHLALPVPMTADDGKINVVMPDDTPALAVVHANGSVVNDVRIRIPEGHVLLEPRLRGSRLITEL
jgi:hypothetical protein